MTTSSSSPEREDRPHGEVEVLLREEEARLLREARDLGPPKPSTWLEWAGLQLILVVLGLMAAFVGGVIVYWMVATPSIASFGNPVTDASLALHQKASDLVFQQVTSLLDLVVFKALLPVLTAVLGYTFARVLQRPSSNGGS